MFADHKAPICVKIDPENYDSSVYFVGRRPTRYSQYSQAPTVYSVQFGNGDQSDINDIINTFEQVTGLSAVVLDSGAQIDTSLLRAVVPATNYLYNLNIGSYPNQERWLCFYLGNSTYAIAVDSNGKAFKRVDQSGATWYQAGTFDPPAGYATRVVPVTITDSDHFTIRAEVDYAFAHDLGSPTLFNWNG